MCRPQHDAETDRETDPEAETLAGTLQTIRQHVRGLRRDKSAQLLDQALYGSRVGHQTIERRKRDQDRNDPEQAVEGKGRGGHRRVIAERLAADIA